MGKSGLKVNLKHCNNIDDLQKLIEKCTLEMERYMYNKTGLPLLSEEIKVELDSDKDICLSVFCEYKTIKDEIVYKKYPSRIEYESFGPKEIT